MRPFVEPAEPDRSGAERSAALHGGPACRVRRPRRRRGWGCRQARGACERPSGPSRPAHRRDQEALHRRAQICWAARAAHARPVCDARALMHFICLCFLWWRCATLHCTFTCWAISEHVRILFILYYYMNELALTKRNTCIFVYTVWVYGYIHILIGCTAIDCTQCSMLYSSQWFALQELRARLYEKLGQANQAQATYNDLLQRNPDRREYYEGLARVHGHSTSCSLHLFSCFNLLNSTHIYNFCHISRSSFFKWFAVS